MLVEKDDADRHVVVGNDIRAESRDGPPGGYRHARDAEARRERLAIVVVVVVVVVMGDGRNATEAENIALCNLQSPRSGPPLAEFRA